MGKPITLLQLLKKGSVARILLNTGDVVTGIPFSTIEDIGPDEEDDGFLIQTIVDGNYVYIDVIESQIISVEEVAA